MGKILTRKLKNLTQTISEDRKSLILFKDGQDFILTKAEIGSICRFGLSWFQYYNNPKKKKLKPKEEE